MTRFFLTAGVFCAAMLAFGETPGGPTSGGVVLEIDGQKVTLAELERTHPGRLFSAYNSFYQAERKAVEEYVDEILLDRRAKQEHLTVAELLEKHVNGAIAKDPSDESLRVYFEGVETSEPYETVRPQILDHVRQRRLAKAKAEYMKSLRADAKISIVLPAPRSSISLKDTPVKGRVDAPVMIIEYADYECPYCVQQQPVLDKIAAEYKDKIAFAYKDVPLPMHSHAQKAAEAAHCAGNQGKYWEFHDMLFAGKGLEVEKLKEHAATLKLDTKVFDKCLDDNTQAEIVKAQLAEGQAFKLEGTPSFFINGRFFSGSFKAEELRAVLDEEIAAAKVP